MTRARRSIAIMANGRHPFVSSGNQHILYRAAPVASSGVPFRTVYQMPELKIVDLSWAGRLGNGHASLAAIEASKVSDPIQLARDGTAWVILNRNRAVLAKMAKSWSPPDGLRFLRGEVGAIVRWRKSDNEEEYRDYVRRDEWEAVLPELVFA
jgi:ATP-dependent DNA helicase RecQ